MNWQEYLITSTGEEGSEISQICSKALRFGLDDVYTLISDRGEETKNPDSLSNRERLVGELNDLLGLTRCLVSAGIIPPDWQDTGAQLAKVEKVRKYAAYARRVGALNDQM